MAVKEVTAGELKQTVTIKSATVTRNSEGSKEVAYNDEETARAKIVSTNYRTQQIAPALLHTDTVYLRYTAARSGIKKDWLINYDGLDRVIQEIEYLGTEGNEFIKLIVKTATDGRASFTG